MSPATRALLLLAAVAQFTACSSKAGLTGAVLSLEQEVRSMRSESQELQKRINELETRLGEMYEETANQSKHINEMEDGLR